jgi:hypothetical protein
MSFSVRWIVSAENNPYLAWQCALFWRSATSHCGVEPSFMIHQTGTPRDPLFDRFSCSDRLIFAPSYRYLANGRLYVPRNNVGTLIEAARRFREDWFILFDPDMIFTRDPEFRCEWSGDRVEYGPEGMRVGAPYVIPREMAAEFASRWLEQLDSETSFEWTISMWAFVKACRDLGIVYRETDHCLNNYHPGVAVTKPIIHYCYNNPKWSKRAFLTDSSEVFKNIPTGIESSVEEEIFQQLRETAATLFGQV